MLAFQVLVIGGSICFLVWAKGNAKKPPVKPLQRPRTHEFG